MFGYCHWASVYIIDEINEFRLVRQVVEEDENDPQEYELPRLDNNDNLYNDEDDEEEQNPNEIINQRQRDQVVRRLNQIRNIMYIRNEQNQFVAVENPRNKYNKNGRDLFKILAYKNMLLQNLGRRIDNLDQQRSIYDVIEEKRSEENPDLRPIGIRPWYYRPNNIDKVKPNAIILHTRYCTSKWDVNFFTGEIIDPIVYESTITYKDFDHNETGKNFDMIFCKECKLYFNQQQQQQQQQNDDDDDDRVNEEEKEEERLPQQEMIDLTLSDNDDDDDHDNNNNEENAFLPLYFMMLLFLFNN
jgi:hypothetical protein